MFTIFNYYYYYNKRKEILYANDFYIYFFVNGRSYCTCCFQHVRPSLPTLVQTMEFKPFLPEEYTDCFIKSGGSNIWYEFKDNSIKTKLYKNLPKTCTNGTYKGKKLSIYTFIFYSQTGTVNVKYFSFGWFA